MIRKYDVHTYDVWGNAKDGYNVNDVYPRSATIELADDAEDADIIRALKNAGILRSKARYSSFDIDGETGYTLYVNYSPTSYPLCELRAQPEPEPVKCNREDRVVPILGSIYCGCPKCEPEEVEEPERWDGQS